MFAKWLDRLGEWWMSGSMVNGWDGAEGGWLVDGWIDGWLVEVNEWREGRLEWMMDEWDDGLGRGMGSE